MITEPSTMPNGPRGGYAFDCSIHLQAPQLSTCLELSPERREWRGGANQLGKLPHTSDLAQPYWKGCRRDQHGRQPHTCLHCCTFRARDCNLWCPGGLASAAIHGCHMAPGINVVLALKTFNLKFTTHKLGSSRIPRPLGPLGPLLGPLGLSFIFDHFLLSQCTSLGGGHTRRSKQRRRSLHRPPRWPCPAQVPKLFL